MKNVSRIARCLSSLTVLAGIYTQTAIAQVKPIPAFAPNTRPAPNAAMMLPANIERAEALQIREDARAARNKKLHAIPKLDKNKKPIIGAPKTDAENKEISQIRIKKTIRNVPGKVHSLSTSPVARPGQRNPSQKRDGLKLQDLTPNYSYQADPLNFSTDDYRNNLYTSWGSFLAPSASEYIQVNFSYVDLENTFDHIYVVDALGRVCDTITGFHRDYVSAACPGAYAEIVVSTDGSNSGYDVFGSVAHYGFYANGYTYAITPPNVPPVAFAYADKYTAVNGAVVSFTGDFSSDVNAGDELTYLWNFGDGLGDASVSRVANPTHKYLSAGTFTVTLTVTDLAGASDTDWFVMTVSPAADAKDVIITPTLKTLAFTWSPGDTHTKGYYINLAEGDGSDLTCATSYPFVPDSTGALAAYWDDLKPLTHYTFLICAYNDNDQFAPGLLYDAVTAVPAQAPKNVSISPPSAGEVVISFDAAEEGRSYQLEARDTLSPNSKWVEVQEQITQPATGVDQPLSFKERIDRPSRFFRVKAVE